MALQGTIGDFGLPEILQLIGIQRKTGRLTLENDSESVTVKFLEGSVVGADTCSGGVEDRLGAVLVRTGKITEAQLDEALHIQKRTLQRLGHVLVKSNFISEDELIEALRVQSLQIIYRLFRWREGKYHVHMQESVDYDEQHFVPVAAETILMEGARMVDEWPIIERRIKSDHIVFRATEAASTVEPEVESLVEDDVDFQFGFEGEAEPESAPPETDAALRLSSDERQILSLVDGERTVQEIADRSSLGDFDTYRILAELLTRDLIEEVPTERVTPTVSAGSGVGARVLGVALFLALAIGVIVSVISLPDNRMAPWSVAAGSRAPERLQLAASRAKLERLGQAVQVFYLDAGTYPAHLDLLAQHGYVEPRSLLDPWGRAYGYSLSAGGYQLQGLGPDGMASSELRLSRVFSATQRMMLDEISDPEP
jgi:hypothetical protein